MNQIARIIGLTLLFFITNICNAQKNQGKITIGHNPSKFPVLYFIDNLCISDTSAIRKINLKRSMIKKILLENDTVFGYNNKLKFVGTINVTTKNKYNFGLKNISRLSGDWMKKHPFTLYMLNDQLLQDDFIKYNILSKIIVEDIKGIELRPPEIAIKEYGPRAFDGVFIIKTK